MGEKIKKWGEEWNARITARARSNPKYTTRWRIMSGRQDIDLNNPQVRIEWELCDIQNAKLVYKGRHTEEFLQKLPPECKKMYYAVDSEGHSYAEMVENPKFFMGLLKGMGILKRGNKKEIEKLLLECEYEENQL